VAEFPDVGHRLAVAGASVVQGVASAVKKEHVRAFRCQEEVVADLHVLSSGSGIPEAKGLSSLKDRVVGEQQVGGVRRHLFQLQRAARGVPDAVADDMDVSHPSRDRDARIRVCYQVIPNRHVGDW
jgi:hypothetical protein